MVIKKPRSHRRQTIIETVSFFVICWLFFVSVVSAQDNVPKLVKKVSDSVVLILAYDESDKLFAQGSGFFLEDCSVLTNLHVILDSSKVRIKLKDKSIIQSSGVIAVDVNQDLAIISNQMKTSCIPLHLSTDVPAPGESVIVVGNPLGLEQSVSNGIVSSIRDIPKRGKIIQITAPISHGSSGSPVINSEGDAIGIATFQISEGQNLNFAVPVSAIKAINRNDRLTAFTAFRSDNIGLEYALSNNNQDLFLIDAEGRYGYIRSSGEIAIEPKYDDAYDFKDGRALVKVGGRRSKSYECDFSNLRVWEVFRYLDRVFSESGSFGYIDANGKTVINPQFSHANEFSNGLASFSDNDKYGYIDAKGKIVILPQFSFAGDFKGDFARVELGDKWGCINKGGKFIVNPIYNQILCEFTEGLAAFSIEDKSGFVDTIGNIIIRPQFSDAHEFSEGLASVRIGEKWGFINKEGLIQIDPQFDWAYDFHDGLALVNIGCKMNKDGFPEGGIMGYINHKGQYVINPQYKQAKDYSDGLAAVLVDKRWGFIDKQGSQQISMQFEDAESFKHGFARVMLNGKIGIINKAGKYVIDPIYNCLENFDRGLARFAFGKEWINWGYINSGGKIVWQRALKREQ